jgi:hypothetical protein
MHGSARHGYSFSLCSRPDATAKVRSRSYEAWMKYRPAPITLLSRRQVEQRHSIAYFDSNDGGWLRPNINVGSKTGVFSFTL